jgi:hypothetical protein
VGTKHENDAGVLSKVPATTAPDQSAEDAAKSKAKEVELNSGSSVPK